MKKIETIELKPNLFKRYFEIPQGVFAYQTLIHQNIKVGLKKLEAKPGDYVVRMRGAIFVIGAQQFKSRFIGVPNSAVSAHIGFQDKDDNVRIAVTTRVGHGNGGEPPKSEERKEG